MTLEALRRASFCVGVCAGSASMASSLLSPVGGYLKVRTLFASPACSLIRSPSRVRAVSTSVASSSLKKEATASSPAIVQPSVTWGIIPHPPESSREVLDFLEREGIDTMELRDVELPTSVEVMQERLDFLKKLGLSLETINSYPLMVTCSIKKNLVPVLDYLEQLGLRSRDLPAFLEKYPMVLHSSVVIDLMPVVEYLLGLDIQRKDIIRVLARFPDVLGYRLEGTMSTSVGYLVSLGVRMRCIGRMLTEYPEILGMRVANNIKPKVDFLVSYGIPKAVVAKILETRPYILGFDLSETMQVAVNDLLEAGVRKEVISAIITQYPDILGQSIKQNLVQKTKWLVQQVKVEPSNVPLIIEKLPQVLFIKEGLAMERVRYFMSAGCSADDVAKMVSDCPQIMALSISQVIEPSLNFLLHDMKRSMKEAVKFPTYFTYDLKSRIMPRYKLIAEKGIKCSLEWFLNCTDQRFKLRLSADYLEDDEELGHVFQMGGVVFTETKQVQEVASTKEGSVSGLNQQAPRQQATKKEQSRLSYWRGRQAVKSQHQRSENKFGTASDSDFEGFFGGEDELDMSELPSEFEDSVSDLNQQVRQCAAKKEPPRLSHGRVRQAVRLHHQRCDDNFGTASDSDFEGFFGEEDELDMSETMSESPSEFEGSVSGLNQQAKLQAAMKEQPRLSHGRVRQAFKLQHQRSDSEFGTTSDSDIEGFLGKEDELDMSESPTVFDDDDDEIDM